MKKPLIGTFAALVLAGGTALTGAAPAQADPVGAVTFAGTVALSNCSGSVVRMPNSAPTDPALVLSNGHCLETGMPGPGQVVTNQASNRTFILLNPDGSDLATLTATQVVYSAMTDTDVTIYQLNTDYATIQSQYGIAPLTVADTHPVQGADIRVVSGYWKKIYSCSVDGFAYQLNEADWTFKDSVRYTPSCDVIGGTSGSPVVDASTGLLVAVNNTINENGESCTLNNPCEVDQSGGVTVHQGIGYAQETYLIPACFGPGNQLDLTLPNCVLPRP
ncbi:trypsin-like peptidase domain-containing protein [Kitasatospora sp. NPDC101183]|uniref:trypsin-like peptidase domain-containing protein n=1 Tax=Kitasatospora sp. NPDC101183 TaxID=3364100 RepID=UPI0038229B06